MSRMRQRAESYTNHEYLDMFQCFAKSYDNPEEARLMYQAQYPNREVPEAAFFPELYRRLRETGSFREVLDDDPNRPIEEQIRFQYNENARARMKPISQRLHTSLWKVWHTIYNKTKDSEPNNPNAEQINQKQIAKFLSDADAEDRNFLTSILWTGETRFGKESLTSPTEEQNAQNQTSKANDKDFEVNVWMGILKNKLYGPYFLPDVLTDTNYTEFLQAILEDLLIEHRFDIIYQHDGGSEYFGQSVKDYLNDKFPNKWMSKDGPIPWERNSELSPLNYNIWPKMCSIVYDSSQIKTIAELKERIKKAGKEIQKTLKMKVVESDMRKRLCYFLRYDGNEQVMGGASSSLD